MTRTAKTDRLPRRIREEPNRRLADGETGKCLVDWLNGLPGVQAVLAVDFDGRPINEQNLSDWKQNGFEDWLRHQEARDWTRRLAEEEDDLKEESGAVPLAERLIAVVLVQLGRLLGDLSATPGDLEKGKGVLGAAQQLTNLLRGKAITERVRLEREYWEAKQAKEREKKREDLEWAADFQRIKARLFPHLDEDFLPHSANTLPEELRACLAASARLRLAQSEGAIKANQGESSQIKAKRAAWDILPAGTPSLRSD